MVKKIDEFEYEGKTLCRFRKVVDGDIYEAVLPKNLVVLDGEVVVKFKVRPRWKIVVENWDYKLDTKQVQWVAPETVPPQSKGKHKLQRRLR